ncbi:MAG: hypothetical protein ING89_16140 [Rubrivivax sp.]|nr:hypothetical protein [Rubrivivax sp.]
MNYASWLDDAWNRHPDDPAGVLADTATTGAALAADDDAVDGLLRLAHHVAGAHLGRPEHLAEGRALLARLAGHAAAGEAARASAALFDRSLALTGGDATVTADVGEAEAVRVRALAASNLADRDAPRAGTLLAKAAAAAERAELSDTDPAVRALAVAGNNIAAALEELPARDASMEALMLQAAELGLVYWRRAGTWLHEERAHYRLALCTLAAGRPALARHHATACLAIVAREGDTALEAFFGWAALARVEAAEGQRSGFTAALARQRLAFDRLDQGDRAWCHDTLVQVEALTAAPAHVSGPKPTS